MRSAVAVKGDPPRPTRAVSGAPGARRSGSIALLLAIAIVAIGVGIGAAPFVPAGSASSRASGSTHGPVVADTVTAAQVALGDRIFHGKEGGAICATCHGANAKGAPGMGPDLTDAKWLHGDGGLEFLRTIITSGVTKPRESGVVMPPFGGTPLQPAQVEAVAAYIWSLSHKSG